GVFREARSAHRCNSRSRSRRESPPAPRRAFGDGVACRTSARARQALESSISQLQSRIAMLQRQAVANVLESIAVPGIRGPQDSNTMWLARDDESSCDPYGV